MSESTLVKYKTHIYKEKLRIVQKGNKNLLRSTTRLRIRCARKDQTIQLQNKLIQAQAKALEKAEGKINLGVKPKRHKYGVALIWMAVHFQAMLGLSYRQVQEVVRRFILAGRAGDKHSQRHQHSELGQKNGLSSAEWSHQGTLGKQYSVGG